MPEILSIAEVDLLLRQPKTDTPKGIRDKAMLEMLYATGIRVSELIHLKIQDVNLMMGYITCRDEKERRTGEKGVGAVSGECARSPDAWTG